MDFEPTSQSLSVATINTGNGPKLGLPYVSAVSDSNLLSSRAYMPSAFNGFN